MKTQLLPPVFKKIAIIILVIAILSVLSERSELILDYFKNKHHISNQASSFILPGDYVRFTFYLDQAIPILLIISILLLVLSRNKVEDEWIRQKRLVSYKIAFFSVPVLTILFLKSDPSVIIFSNLILIGLIQIVSFLFLVKIQPRFIKYFDEK